MKIFFGMALFGLFIVMSACSKTEPPMPTPRTDALTLDLEYEGKSYLEDGVGEVVLATCEDGDTAEFIVDNQQIRVRFLGIDTPEASHFFEPWGYQATQFVCQQLADAETIVLERDFDSVLMDTYGRYLAFVWYDGRLINLETVEKAYSPAVGAIGLKYGSELVDAWLEVQKTGRRIHGETDPLFDYSTEGKETTIESIITNPEFYHFKVVTVEGVVTAKVGIHAYIEAEDYGIYFYIGHNPSSALVVGNIVRLENVRVIYDLERMGGIHLTDYPKADVSVLGQEEVQPLDITLELLEEEHLGRLIRLTDLTIRSIERHIDGSFTLGVKDGDGFYITILHPRNVPPSMAVDPDSLQIGENIGIIGPLRDAPSGWKLLLTDSERLIRDE